MKTLSPPHRPALLLALLISIAFLTGSMTACTRSGGKQVWIYTSIYKEVIEEMKGPLQKAVPEADIQWFQGGSENVASKLSAELAAGHAKADLILTSDPFWYLELKSAGKLLPVHGAVATQGTPAAFADPDGAFTGVRLPVILIGYNESAIAASEAPKSWKDLLDPKWKGKIAMPSPLESGTAFTAVALLSKNLGWEYFQALQKQDVLAAGGNSSVITRIETKERPIGIVLLENILKAREKGSPVQAVYPSDGAIPVNSPIAILKDTRNPELARKVHDWFFSDEAQKAMVKSGMYSLIPGIPSHPGARPWKEVQGQLLRWSPEIAAELFSKREEIKTRFAETVLRAR